MREKMKKMLFLMLFLIILGAANVISQVRIGGNGQPNPAAVLDLNADNNATGTKGLALPRVSLTDATTPLTGSPTVNGMMIYNTNASVGAGIYYWDTNKWIKVSDGGNEFSDTIPGGGLTMTGGGTASNPYKVGIKAGGVTSDKLSDMSAVEGDYLAFKGGKWTPYSNGSFKAIIQCDGCDSIPVGGFGLIRLHDSLWWQATPGILNKTCVVSSVDWQFGACFDVIVSGWNQLLLVSRVREGNYPTTLQFSCLD
ncbi:hypothetical protein FACS189451_10050 [Bacteroidia bacterium]|nr:hypothetical protein FACS189451_10050 [Bacteroidia bacterium]